jgi:hypothetical protein
MTRRALLAFGESIDSRASALRRDDCGDWAIWGTNGHIYAVPDGFQLMIGCDAGNHRWSSARGWESAKKRLGFGKVTQDGDREGSIVLDRLPSKSEAVEIRDILGIPQARHLSEERRAIVSEMGTANLKRAKAQREFKPVLPASGDGPATISRHAPPGEGLCP